MNAWKNGKATDSPASNDTGERGLLWRDAVSTDVFECASVDAAEALGNWKSSKTGKRRGRKVLFPKFRAKHKDKPRYRLVLDTMPPLLHARGDARRRADQLSTMTDRPDAAGDVARRGAVRRTALVTAGVLDRTAAAPEGAVAAGDWLVDRVVWKGWAAALRRAVDEWAAANPLSPGLAPEAAVRRAGIPDPRLIGALAAEAGLVVDNHGVRGRETGIRFPEPVRPRVGGICGGLRDAPFAAPGAADLARQGLSRRHLAAAVASGLLYRVADGVYLLPDALPEAVRRLAGLGQPFTVSQARAVWDTSRRVAVPLLEHLDQRGLTCRIDAAHRIVRR
ncbi:SelB domain-containing protein [Actinoplanes flavus]|nr:SelB C-terminal domain-containing protein [Actinoplanes flavus]